MVATPGHVQGGGSDNGANTTPSISVTLPQPVGLGNTIIIHYGLNNVTGTITDDKGNIYTYLPVDNAGAPGGTYRVQIAYCINITNSPKTFTLTTSFPTMYEAMSVDEFSGVAAFDVSTTQNGTSTSFPTGYVTPSGDNELLYTSAWATTSGPVSVAAPFAFLQFAGSSNNVGCAFYVQPKAAAIQAVWLPPQSQGGTARIAAFNPVIVVPPTDLAGDLAPSLSFAADLTIVWTPANLGSNLLGWFDGADAATVTIAGSGVSAWRNKGVSSFTLTQGSDAYKPSYTANSVVFADNSSQYLAAGSPPAAYDLLIVAKPNSYNDWRTLFLSVSGTTTENTILIQNTGQLGIYQATLNQAGGLTWANNTSGLCYAQISNAGPVLMSRDGGALASTGVAQLGIPLQGVGSSGSFDVHSYTQGFGAVYELTFVPYNSSLDTRQRLEGYAAWKWGLQALLPSGHPYKAAPPTPGGVPPVQDLAGDLAPSVTLGAALSFLTSFAGDLAPAMAFAADITVIGATLDLAGGLTPSLAFAADLTVVTAVQTSKYGKGSYGVNHYSRVATLDLAGNLAPSITLKADFDIIGQQFFDGDLRPAVSFAGALSLDLQPFTGDLAPQVTFTGTLGLLADLSGDLAPQIALAGSLTLDLPFQGDLPFEVGLAAPSLISGPLWAASEPCPSPPWTPAEPCPPSMWTPVPPPTFVPPSGGWTKQEEVDDLPVWGDAKN